MLVTFDEKYHSNTYSNSSWQYLMQQQQHQQQQQHFEEEIESDSTLALGRRIKFET